jgi:DNA helicase-2/ATP-dependent DNA helicase PcrA
MSEVFTPRQAQAEILAYRAGRLGVAAVPGSGKTLTISALAAQLAVDLPSGARVLVVTYQNAAVGALVRRISRQLEALGQPRRGFEVRTLHGLAHGLIAEQPGLAGLASDFSILDEIAARDLLERALASWRSAEPSEWEGLLEEAQSAGGRRPSATQVSRRLVGIAATMISTAKNRGLSADDLDAKIKESESASGRAATPMLAICAKIYRRYAGQLTTAGSLDFDDLVRLAVDLLDQHPELRRMLGARWPYILEDEAQDSVPLQEALLGRIAEGHSAAGGNWVRVGDPNQAITSSFTAADPRSLWRFLEAPETKAVEMDVSGRSAAPIIELANHLVTWTCEEHPLQAVRNDTFRQQMIRATSPGDPQRNPEAAASRIAFRAFRDRDQEMADCVQRAAAFALARPEMTLGILVPTNAVGAAVAERLRSAEVAFDERLRSSAGSRRVAGLLAALLGYFADPQDRSTLVEAYDALRELAPEEAALALGDADRIRPLLRSCRPEQLLYPLEGRSILDALPPVQGLDEVTIAALEALAAMLSRWLRARALPVDQLVLTLGREALSASDMPTVERIARLLRHRVDREPERALPALAAELRQLAFGRGSGLVDDENEGFEARPGIITLSTMHRAKGLEWDLVYLLGVDGEWFPHGLEDHSPSGRGFAAAEQSRRALISLAESSSPTAGDDAAELARIGSIQERLRLLYVGITRARVYLSVSWSQGIPRAQGSPRPVPMAEAWRELKHFHEGRGDRGR